MARRLQHTEARRASADRAIEASAQRHVGAPSSPCAAACDESRLAAPGVGKRRMRRARFSALTSRFACASLSLPTARVLRVRVRFRATAPQAPDRWPTWFDRLAKRSAGERCRGGAGEKAFKNDITTLGCCDDGPWLLQHSLGIAAPQGHRRLSRVSTPVTGLVPSARLHSSSWMSLRSTTSDPARLVRTQQELRALTLPLRPHTCTPPPPTDQGADSQSLPLMLASLNCALLTKAPTRMASEKSASSKSADSRSALVRLAPWKLALTCADDKWIGASGCTAPRHASRRGDLVPWHSPQPLPQAHAPPGRQTATRPSGRPARSWSAS